MIARFLREETGATAIEYALIASLIAVAVVGAVILLGEETAELYQDIATKVTEAMS